MPNETLHWGVLGCGHIVHDFTLALEKGDRKHKVIFRRSFQFLFLNRLLQLARPA
jgi:hypothetical protein